jgi:hypothetical protein
MGERYAKEINDLREWLKLRLPALGKFKLTRDQWEAGTDSLKNYHADLIRDAFIEWLTTREYELSYNQMCAAFFAAADACDVMEVDPPRTNSTQGKGRAVK